MSNAPPARILVVDDAPLIRGLLVQALRKYEYYVDTAEDGQQAIEYFINHRPDLILMDADMPVLDGVAACARIRQLPEAKHLPIIIVTSYVEREWVDRAYAAGATDYVTKPVNWAVLRNRIHYILQAKRAEEALFDEKEKAQITLASISDGVITTNIDGQVEYLNPVAIKMTGWTIDEVQGLPLSQVFSIVNGNTQQPIEFPVERCLKEGKLIELELTNNTVLIHRDKKQQFAIEDSAAPIKDRNGQIVGVIVGFRDVTENRKLTQELYYNATHDALTGLFNRREFSTKLKRLLDNQRQQHSPNDHVQHALLYLDMDQFKIVNDTCGHEAGDQLLKDVALILKRQINQHTMASQATLARLGGDEFALLLESCSEEKALTVADSIVEGIKTFKFLWTDDKQQHGIFTVGISIGLVWIFKQNIDQKSLLAMADAACYAAKNAGRNCVHVYQEKDADLLDKNKDIKWLSLINDNLEKADGFALFHQLIKPFYMTEAGNHYEILLRMNDHQGNLVPPGSFLSTAARYNLMPTVDRWVVRTVLEWLKEHPRHVEKLTFGTVNISGYSLNDKDFLDFLISYIPESAIPPEKICFEINETIAITNLTGALNFITTLKKLGCLFALDDFGSGMSSFAYLKDLPVDFIKIDKNLIKGIVNDTVNYAMVKAINDIAHLMHCRTIAECVESELILEKLKEINVDYVQGYYIGKPLPLID